MRFRVEIVPRARIELRQAANWYYVRSDSAAVSKTWIDGFLKLIASLAEMPERCSLAHENDLFPVELREIHYGSGRRKTHRAVFYIVNGVVMVIAIRHFAQDDLSPDVL